MEFVDMLTHPELDLKLSKAFENGKFIEYVVDVAGDLEPFDSYEKAYQFYTLQSR